MDKQLFMSSSFELNELIISILKSQKIIKLVDYTINLLKAA